MYQNRIIPQEVIKDFTGNRDSLLLRRTNEHNLRAVAKLYKNIRIKDLSVLMGMSMTAVEDMTRQMIQENRLNARIDQMDQEITFDDESEILYSWDKHINETLLDVNNIIEMIKECEYDLV